MATDAPVTIFYSPGGSSGLGSSEFDKLAILAQLELAFPILIHLVGTTAQMDLFATRSLQLFPVEYSRDWPGQFVTGGVTLL